jgi:4-diphosphocytidyl-2C-methyl-D-erythritol kinase
VPAAPALIAVPAVGVATPDAYRWWDDNNPDPGPRGPVLLDAEAFSGWGSVGRLGGNDFELPVFGKHPELRELFERLASTRPLWVRLSGSGSAVAAVYKSTRDRDDAAAAVGRKTVTLITTTTMAVAAGGPVSGD